MPRSSKNKYHQFLLILFKMSDTVNFEDIFLYISTFYQTRMFHSNSVILIVFAWFLQTVYFHQYLLGGVRVNDSISIENHFPYSFSCYLCDP